MDDFPFWSFSIDRYMRPGVSRLCLNLQERHQLDVNILLFSLWLADQDKAVDHELFVQLIQGAEEFHTNVVKPLRHTRQRLKLTTYGLPEDQAEAFRTTIKARELAAEKLEQQLLFSAFSSMFESETHVAGTSTDLKTLEHSARRNLDIYYAHLGLQQSDADHQELAELVTLCFPKPAG